MSGNRHNIYVVLEDQGQGRLRRGDLVRDGGTAVVHWVEDVETHRMWPLAEDKMALVGCVTNQLWHCVRGPEYDLGVLAREGVRRTAEHVLSEQVAS